MQTTVFKRKSLVYYLLRWLGYIVIGVPALIITMIVTFFLFAMLFLGSEEYFAPFPAIGTSFSPGYSEAGFDQIRVGDLRERVRTLIGDPLTDCDAGSSYDLYWCYSIDGGFCCWDFAWLVRAVRFDENGRVSAILRDIHYD